MSDTTRTFIPIGLASELPANECRRVEAQGCAIALFNLDGEFYALNDRCTHGNASLSEGWVEDGEVECPLHAGRFDIRTGRATCEPCKDDVESYPVQMEDGQLRVGLPARETST